MNIFQYTITITAPTQRSKPTMFTHNKNRQIYFTLPSQ